MTLLYILQILLVVAVACSVLNQTQALRVWIWPKANAFVHDSIPDGINMIQRIASRHGWSSSVVTDMSQARAQLATNSDTRHIAVLLQNTGENQLAPEDMALFQNTVMNQGIGIVAIHGASDAMRSWSWYGDCLIGARFNSHPPPSVGRIMLANPQHPVTSQTFNILQSTTWNRLDEWYGWDRDPRSNPNIAGSLQVLGYADHTAEHQSLIWTHMCGRSRVVYSAIGHFSDAYRNDPDFEALIESSMVYVSGY